MKAPVQFCYLPCVDGHCSLDTGIYVVNINLLWRIQEVHVLSS